MRKQPARIHPTYNNVHRDISHIASLLWSRLATAKAKMDDVRALGHQYCHSPATHVRVGIGDGTRHTM
jgi:hypothetical protein